MHAPPPPATAYEHRYLRAIAAHHPGRSATGAPAWNHGHGPLLDELATRYLQDLALEGLIALHGETVQLTQRGDRRLAFWEELASRQQPPPTGQLALL